MSVEMWDPDQAVTRGELDEDLEGCSSVDRYGVTEREEISGEPLDVALEQEEAEVTEATDDDQWVLVEDTWEADGRLFAEGEPDGPEERAMHVEIP